MCACMNVKMIRILIFHGYLKKKKIHGKNNCKGNDSQEMDKKTKTITKK